MRDLVFGAAVCTDSGSFREINEDNYALSGKFLPPAALRGRFVQDSVPTDSIVCGVFDGIGSDVTGEEASRIGAMYLSRFTQPIIKEGMGGFCNYLSASNIEICRAVEQQGYPMGTTAAVLSASEGGATAYSLGDSRVYLWRDGNLILLTKDHTPTEQLIDSGELTPEEATTDKRRHHISQYLGMDTTGSAFTPFESMTFLPKKGDRYLLCTDGISDVLPGYKIARIMAAGQDPQAIAEALVRTAFEAGSRDNCTALVICADSPKDSPGRATEFAVRSGRSLADRIFTWTLTLLSGFLLGVVMNLLLHIMNII